jgi:hypothetical protein
LHIVTGREHTGCIERTKIWHGRTCVLDQRVCPWVSCGGSRNIHCQGAAVHCSPSQPLDLSSSHPSSWSLQHHSQGQLHTLCSDKDCTAQWRRKDLGKKKSLSLDIAK